MGRPVCLPRYREATHITPGQTRRRPYVVKSHLRLSRQINLELSSLAGQAGEIDEPAMPSNYGSDGRKPQSRPMTSLFGRKEGVEDAVHDFARNADAGVSHADEDISLWPGAFFVQIPVFSLDQKGAACGHRVA